VYETKSALVDASQSTTPFVNATRQGSVNGLLDRYDPHLKGILRVEPFACGHLPSGISTSGGMELQFLSTIGMNILCVVSTSVRTSSGLAATVSYSKWVDRNKAKVNKIQNI
jgi:hypothetical protein